jgi:A/G-specific adenine glycosylase
MEMRAGGQKLNASLFRRKLMRWYRQNARVLPWRGVDNPYKVWISEIMLQQTRVQAVIEHYKLFLEKFPTIKKLAAAPEQDVLAAWSGLGYYRRARMMHAAAKIVADEHGGVLPKSSAELRALPGIGEYTSAAIASIAFGESIAVVDGNVERVLLRLTGRPEDMSAAGKRFIAEQAQALVPKGKKAKTKAGPSTASLRDSAQDDKYGENAPGEHNQAMMELGATVCLPRGPLCLQCPVYALCRTRGEHKTAPRAKGFKRTIAYLFVQRSRKSVREVLLVQRAADASLMANMWELPPLSMEVVAPYEPMLAVKHGITDTTYDVKVYAERELEQEVSAGETVRLRWVQADQLPTVALTGLARKILRKMDVMVLRAPRIARDARQGMAKGQ